MHKKVLVFGTFDYFHLGHAFLLTEALKRGSVTVTIARDETVLKIKGSLPDHSAAERLQKIKKEFPTVTVALGSTTNYLESVHTVEPDIILLGYDQHLPPGINETDLPATIERLAAFKPEKYKSSLVKLQRDANSNGTRP